MGVMFATGGLDHVAMALGEVVTCGIFLLSAGLVVLSWWKHSLVSVGIASVLLLGVGALLQPWTLIAPPPSNDPADAFWLFRLRVISIVWLLLVMVTAACVVRVVRYRTFKTKAHNAA